MPVEDHDKIDIEVVFNNDDLRMVIIDDLAWTDRDTIIYHINTLMKKINRYLDFAETDAFRESYPNTTLDKLTIEVMLRYPPTTSAVEDVFVQLTDKLAREGVKFVYGMLPA